MRVPWLPPAVPSLTNRTVTVLGKKRGLIMSSGVLVKCIWTEMLQGIIWCRLEGLKPLILIRLLTKLVSKTQIKILGKWSISKKTIKTYIKININP